MNSHAGVLDAWLVRVSALTGENTNVRTEVSSALVEAAQELGGKQLRWKK